MCIYIYICTYVCVFNLFGGFYADYAELEQLLISEQK